MQSSHFPQIDHFRRRLKRRRLAAATCWALATAVAAVLALGGLDRVLGIQDLPGRVLITALSIGMAVAILRRWFREVLAPDPSALELALSVERRNPELRDLVTSAIDFSTQAADHPTAGSASLRRAVVLRAATAVEEIDWHQFVPLHPLRRAALACAGALVLLALLTWWTPQAVGTGLARLANPLSPAEWPRENHLEFVDPPAKLAAGNDLVLQLRDAHGAIPADVQIHYRTWQGEKWSEPSERLAVTGETLEVRRTNVGQSLEYRATGGDHYTMPWQTLEVVPPPQIESLVVTVHHPVYTGLGKTPWKEEGRVLEGSRLEVLGVVDQPIANVVLGNDDGRSLLGSVETGGREFRVSIDCTDPQVGGVYVFEFTTTDHVTAQAARRLAIEVVPDESPQVRFIEPTAEQLTLVPWATLPLVIEARDDLALESIELVVRRSDRSDQGDQAYPLWQGPKVGSPQRHRLEHAWQLASLNLQPDSVVEVLARASDFRPTVGQTLYPLQIAIASEDVLWRELGKREAMLLDLVERNFRQQRELHARTADWVEQPEWSPDRLANGAHAVLFGQRQIADTLVGAPESVSHSIEFMLRDLSRNHLDRPEFSIRLHTLRDRLDELAAGPLPQIDQSLGDLVRLMQRGDSPDEESEIRPLIAATIEQQKQVIATLEGALDILLAGNVVGRIERDLTALISDQSQLAEHCRELSRAWLSSSSTPGDHELELAASGQRQLALRFAELTSRMAPLSIELTDDQPQLAARLADAAALARDLELQMTMRSAAEQLAGRRFGRTAVLQRQAVDDLRRLHDHLARRHAIDEAKHIEQLREAERQLQKLRHEVTRLEQEQVRSGSSPRNRLLCQEFARQTEAMARWLKTLHAAGAAQSARRAAKLLAGKRAAREAYPELAEAQRQLAAERRRRQVALAERQMARLQVRLGTMTARAQVVVEEIARLDGLRDSQGQLQQAHWKSVGQLAKRQAILRADVVDEAQILTLLPVYAHLLYSAAGGMHKVSGYLESRQLDRVTHQVALEVVAQLRTLAESLKQQQEQLAKDKKQAGSVARGKPPSDNACQSQVLQLVIGQLRLLRSLQVELRERTQQLENKRATQPAQREALADETRRLAADQRKLIQLAEQLAPEPADPPPQDLLPKLEQLLKESMPPESEANP